MASRRRQRSSLATTLNAERCHDDTTRQNQPASHRDNEGVERDREACWRSRSSWASHSQSEGNAEHAQVTRYERARKGWNDSFSRAPIG